MRAPRAPSCEFRAHAARSVELHTNCQCRTRSHLFGAAAIGQQNIGYDYHEVAEEMGMWLWGLEMVLWAAYNMLVARGATCGGWRLPAALPVPPPSQTLTEMLKNYEMNTNICGSVGRSDAATLRRCTYTKRVIAIECCLQWGNMGRQSANQMWWMISMLSVCPSVCLSVVRNGKICRMSTNKKKYQ